MRHFFVARPIPALSRGMATSPGWTTLIALSSALNSAAPGALSALRGTVNLATVAAPANHDLHPAGCTKKKPCRRYFGMRRQW